MSQRPLYQSGDPPLFWRTCIRPVRESQAMSQSELARRTGIPQPNLIAVENRAREPSVGVLLRIARVLHCTVDDLLEVESVGERDRFSAFCGDHRVVFRASSLRKEGV